MTDFSPREIVLELDRFIVGQQEAKKAVAIALRNRWRRRQLPDELREEIQPKNILMMGPTGVGKTEIARRLAKLEDAPFIKVEATKFTEVGYVGRDVEQIVRDLVEAAIIIVREKRRKEVKVQAAAKAEDDLVNILHDVNKVSGLRDEIRQKLRAGELDDLEVEIQLEETPSLPSLDIPGMPAGAQVGLFNMNDLFGKMLGTKTRTHRSKVKEAFTRLINEESDKLLDKDKIISEAVRTAEETGIVFIDEIDKICSRGSDHRSTADVSREGVQRDLLPIVEGSTVSTKYGPIKTNHILFIASGAFQVAKPSDLLPEFQGRFPVRVELKPLTEEDFRRILTEPKVNIIRQSCALLSTEGVELDFEHDAICKIAAMATQINAKDENIGARRLHTVVEKVIEKLSFSAPDLQEKKVSITAQQVEESLQEYMKKNDISCYIL